MIERPDLLSRIENRFQSNPVVLLQDPRQCGKTTLARQFAAQHGAEYFDLESPADNSRLAQPMTALEPLSGWVVIDEAQLQPGLFPILRSLGGAPQAGRILGGIRSGGGSACNWRS